MIGKSATLEKLFHHSNIPLPVLLLGWNWRSSRLNRLEIAFSIEHSIVKSRLLYFLMEVLSSTKWMLWISVRVFKNQKNLRDLWKKLIPRTRRLKISVLKKPWDFCLMPILFSSIVRTQSSRSINASLPVPRTSKDFKVLKEIVYLREGCVIWIPKINSTY